MANVDPCDNDSHAADCIHHVTGEVKLDDRGFDALAASAASMSPGQFCDHAKQLIGGDRNTDYGDALPNFERTGKLWEVVLGVPVTAEQFALCMVLVKLERLTSTINHQDSWTDIIGYAALGGGIAMRPGRNGNTVNPA